VKNDRKSAKICIKTKFHHNHQTDTDINTETSRNQINKKYVKNKVASYNKTKQGTIA